MAEYTIDKIEYGDNVYKLQDNVSGYVSGGNVIPYLTCGTAAGTAAKTTTLVTGTLPATLTTGTRVAVKFTNSNSIANPTITIGSYGAIAIKRYGTTAPSTSAVTSWNAGNVITLVYDGTYWLMADWTSPNTTYSEISAANITNGSGSSTGLVTGRRAKAAVEAFQTDEKVGISLVESGTMYYPIVGTDTATASREYDSDFTYEGITGTTSTIGTAAISLGNYSDFTTEGNKRGMIRLYGSGSGHTRIYTNATNGEDVYFPNKGGTIALTSDIPTVPTVTDEKLALTDAYNDTTYLPIIGTSDTTAAIRQHTGEYRIYMTETDIGLYLGSDYTYGNKKGSIYLYGTGTSWTKIVAPDSSINRVINLPNKGGTIALTTDIPTVPSNIVNTITTTAGAHTAITSQKGDVSFNVPTKTSHLTNDSGFITSSDIPTIPSITLNGSSTTSPSFYAPTGAGTSGQYLKSSGSGAPTWTNFPTIPSITLNGSSTTSPSFYAPTSAGTSGYYLKSNGSGAPSWTSFPTIVNTRGTPASGGTTLSVVNTGDMYTWNNKAECTNLVNGSATGSLRGTDTSTENSNYTIGQSAFAIGSNTKAIGGASYAEGYESIASNFTAHAQGFGTIASKMAQTALGTFNIEDTSSTTTHPGDMTEYGEYAVIIGNGTTDSGRSNALTIDWQGNVASSGYISISGVNVLDTNNTAVGSIAIDSNGAVEISNHSTSTKAVLDSGFSIVGSSGEIATIKSGGVFIQDHTNTTGAIGHFSSNSGTKATTTPASPIDDTKYTALTNAIKFTAGTWLLVGEASFPSNTNGSRSLEWRSGATSSSLSSITTSRVVVSPSSSGFATRVQSIVPIQSNSDVYVALYGYMYTGTSGTSVTISWDWRAIRIA